MESTIIVDCWLLVISGNLFLPELIYKWVKVFENGRCKICGRQIFKNFAWSILEQLDSSVLQVSPNVSLQSSKSIGKDVGKVRLGSEYIGDFGV